MRKLIVQQWATVDNFVAEDDGGLSFVSARPYDDSDLDIQASVLDFIDGVDTMFIGARTYDMSKDYWPHATEQGEYGTRFNSLAKYVASTKLKEAPWGEFPSATVTADPVATMRQLRQQDGKDIMLWGSLQLMKTMFEAQLVDEVQMRICPRSIKSGIRLFTGGQELRLLDARSFNNGVVLLRYDVLHSR